MSVTVVTWNCPARLGPHKAAMQAIADRGADIICVQENTDRNNWAPRGWKRFRPLRARSNAVYWNPKTVKRTWRRGAYRLSSVGFRSLRYGVWAHFETDEGPMRVMSVHLPAFYHQPKSAAEYDKQAVRLARWARGGRFRVVAGDYNGQTGNKRMRPLDAVLRFSDKVESGPSGQPIDYVATAAHGPYRPLRTVRCRAGARTITPSVEVGRC